MKNLPKIILIMISVYILIFPNKSLGQDTTQNQSSTPNTIFKKRQVDPSEVEPYQFLDNVFVGGNLSLSAASFGGSGNFFVYFSPLIGYKVTKNLNVAVGPLFLYSKYSYVNRYNATGNIAQTIFGPRFFAQQRIYRQFFIHGEIEGMHIQNPDNSQPYKSPTNWIVNPLLGVAIVNDSGNRSFYSLTILYNLAYSSQLFSPYGTPLVVRAGLFFNWRK